jgi:hypothetical protein
MREKPAPGTSERMPESTSVLDELVFVGRYGPDDWATERPLPVPIVADPEPVEPEPTVGQRVARWAVLALLATSIILIIGLAVGYAG